VVVKVVGAGFNPLDAAIRAGQPGQRAAAGGPS
jgi:NADPH:quinone reductase-like Zn-dependent oxidoreductase